MSSLGKSCVTEAIGTFFLCFIGAGVICTHTWMPTAGIGLAGIAVAHGLALAIAVSAAMNVSGGHINPAVTVTMLVTGRIPAGNAIAYIVSQLAGATVAGVLVLTIFKGLTTPDGKAVALAAGLGTPALHAQVGTGLGILIEACMTFLLAFAIFGTAVDSRAPKIGGWGIGLTIAADIMLGGPLTGGAMNPARTFGPGIVAAMSGNLSVFWSQQVVYWVGPIVGAVVAGLIYDNLIMESKK